MIGAPFADIVNLVENFLPKPAIDLTTQKVQEIITSRGWEKPAPDNHVQGELL